MGDVTKFEEFAKRYMSLGPVPPGGGTVARVEHATDYRALESSGCRLDDTERELVLRGLTQPTEALLALSAWWADTKAPAWLVLSGDRGRGKTLALATLAAKTVARYVGAERLCRVFSGNFGDSLEAQEKIVDTCLLMLDDVGTETDDRRMQTTLLELFDARRSRLRHPTVVCTNLDKKGFAKRYPNERLHSRLNLVRWVTVGGEDMRRLRK